MKRIVRLAALLPNPYLTAIHSAGKLFDTSSPRGNRPKFFIGQSYSRKRRVEVFDALMKGAGDEAREVLEKFRGNHAFDPEKILAMELHIALDENFLPIEHPNDDEQIGEYEGTLDLVMIHSLTEADIDDWKSYYQVIDADTFQSKLCSG